MSSLTSVMFNRIPTPQVNEPSDGSSSEDESTIILTNPHTGQTLEEVVAEEHPKLLVEETPPAPTQPDHVIPDDFQGETSSDHTVLEGMEVAISESGDEKDPPTQNDNSQLDSPELEPRPKQQRRPTNSCEVQHTWQSHL